MTLEGVSPRHGQPPRGRRKRVEKAVAKLLPFPLFRDHAVGRSPSAMGWFLHPWARHPSHVHEPACPTRVRALPLLRLLGTPAQVIRLTADGHTPAEPPFCMSAATLHRWSSSARLAPEPERSHGGRATVATARKICTLGSKKAARRSGASTQANGPTTPKRRQRGREWSLLRCDGACTIRAFIVPRTRRPRQARITLF